MNFTETISDLDNLVAHKTAWDGSKYEKIKLSTLTARGSWGEQLLCKILGLKDLVATIHQHGRGGYDVEAPGQRIEAKLATQDTGGSFQFNGIDTERDFDSGFLLGVTPNELYFLLLPKNRLNTWVSPDGGFKKWTLKPIQMVKLTEENFWAAWAALNAG